METVEEAAKRLYPENWQSIMEGKHDTNSFERDAFIAGAKWQAEQMYSVEEVKEIIAEAWLSCEDNEGETFTEANKRILEKKRKDET